MSVILRSIDESTTDYTAYVDDKPIARVVIRPPRLKFDDEEVYIIPLDGTTPSQRLFGKDGVIEALLEHISGEKVQILPPLPPDTFLLFEKDEEVEICPIVQEVTDPDLLTTKVIIGQARFKKDKYVEGRTSVKIWIGGELKFSFEYDNLSDLVREYIERVLVAEEVTEELGEDA